MSDSAGAFPERRESVLSAIAHLSQELANPDIRLAISSILGWPLVSDPTDGGGRARRRGRGWV